MNWGHKILVVYLAFVAGIAVLVIKSTNQKIDLVTSDYYAKELKYQQQIDAIKRTEALKEPVKYEVLNGKIIISFSGDFAAKQLKGSIQLYCPSNDKRDVVKDFETVDGTVTVDVPSVNKGSHELHVSWQSEGKMYYYENRLFL